MRKNFQMGLSGSASVAYWAKMKPLSATDQMAPAMWRATQVMRNDLVKNGFSGKVVKTGLFYSSAAGNSLANRTGATRNRITTAIFRRGNDVYGVVGSPDKHVLANEVGATIRPKRARMLAVPTKNIMTPTGALKSEWASKLAGGGWRGIWNKERLFIQKSKKGTPFIARAAMKGGKYSRTRGGDLKVELLAMLTPSVSLPARHMFRKSAQRVAPQVAAIVNAAVATIYKGKP